MFRTALERLGHKWKSYRHRFLPWVVLNFSKNEKTLRQVPTRVEDKLVPDHQVSQTLVRLFRELERGLDDGARAHAHRRGQDAAFRILGFCVERKPSTLPSAGTGVFVSRGSVPRGATVAMYPGTVYRAHEPILFQSLRNPFIFRCLDGVLLDGKGGGLSKMVYESCAGRDRAGPRATSDGSWLTAAPENPLSVGQYVNNCSDERPANVCYQELDLPDGFPPELRRHLPNVNYGACWPGPLRCVVLVALRDIEEGQELFSNYYTIVHGPDK
ncbi:SET domain-containing protein 9 [Stigmatopora nigra]